MSDKIEAALQPGAPPINLSALKPMEVAKNGGLNMAGATLVLRQILEADQCYLDAAQARSSSMSELASLAHQAQAARAIKSFVPTRGHSFGFVTPETDVTFALPSERKGRWGGYEQYDKQITSANLASVLLTSSRLHSGIYVPNGNTKDAFIRMDVDGLRTRQGPVQLCLGMAALDAIELIPTPSKDDIESTARQIGVTLGLVVN